MMPAWPRKGWSSLVARGEGAGEAELAILVDDGTVDGGRDRGRPGRQEQHGSLTRSCSRHRVRCLLTANLLGFLDLLVALDLAMGAQAKSL
jgi:hypothetical protein